MMTSRPNKARTAAGRRIASPDRLGADVGTIWHAVSRFDKGEMMVDVVMESGIDADRDRSSRTSSFAWAGKAMRSK